MSVEEGLKSTDVEVAKQARGVAKSKVTKLIKTLKLLLICDPTGTFPIDEIDAEKVEENYEDSRKILMISWSYIRGILSSKVVLKILI